MDESKTFAVTELETLLALALVDSLLNPNDDLAPSAVQFLTSVLGAARANAPGVTHIVLPFMPDDVTAKMHATASEAEARLGRN